MKKLLFLLLCTTAFAQTHKTAMQDLNNHMTGVNDFLQPLLLDPVPFASLPTTNGSLGYCSDCQATTPCGGAGTGALFRVENGVANCASGALVVSAAPPPSTCSSGIYAQTGGSGGIFVCLQGNYVLISAGTPCTGSNCGGGGPVIFNLTILGSGNGSGNVATSDGNINCNISAGVTSGTCSFPYQQGTSLTIAANATGGSNFVAFSGGSCTSSPCSFAIAANTSVSAQFTQTTVPISLVQQNNNATFASSQQAGDLNVAVISWKDNTNTISSVTDTAGNTYTGAITTTKPSSSTSSFAQVGSAIGKFSSGPSTSCTMNNTLGDALLIAVSSTFNATTTFSVTDTEGNTWRSTTLEKFQSSNIETQWFYTIAKSTLSGNVITLAPSATGVTYGLGCAEYSGNGTNAATLVDANVFQNATGSTSMSAGNIVTAGSSDLIAVNCADVSTSTSGWAAGANYAFVAGETSSIYAFDVEHRLNVAANTYATPMTGSTTTGWQCNAIALLANTSGGGISQAIYYSPNIAASAANTNSISITWSAVPASFSVHTIEYAGIVSASPVDGTPAGAFGTSTSPASGNTTTSTANDVLVGATKAASSSVSSGTTNFTQLYNDTGNFNQGENRFPVTAASYATAATLSSSSDWVSQIVAFKGSSSGGGSNNVSISITGAGTGNGTVTSNTGGIQCTVTAGVTSGACSASVPAGTVVTLTATPN